MVNSRVSSRSRGSRARRGCRACARRTNFDSLSQGLPIARSFDVLIRDATARGIITPEQERALRSLAADEVDVAPREVARGFNWVTVAYALGALLVVFACGWFLIERWERLGPWGVLGVISAYAVILALASRWLERSGFREAAGISAMLAVALTPVAVWALESLSGWWPEGPWGRPYYPYPPAEASRWLVAELATILMALLVLRRAWYVAVAIPIAVATWGLGTHIPALFTEQFAPVLGSWSMLTIALVLCAIADTVDRWQERAGAEKGGGRGDFAFAFWLVGLIALATALMSFWPRAGALRHGLPVLSLALVALALVLRRRTHLVFGLLGAFAYLLYLAGEVFRTTALFPIVLATLGLLLIFATVWLQRRFPALVERVNATRGGRRGLPGASWIPWLVASASLGITLLKLPEDAEERAQRDFNQRLHILRMHSGSLRPPPSRPVPSVVPSRPPPPRR
jgi:hypothetical protein